MIDDSITPEQAAELLAQAETGEFDLDNLSDDSQADDVDGQDDEQTKPQQTEQAQEGQEKLPVDYMAILAQERAEKLALQDELAKYQTEQNPQNSEQPQAKPPNQALSPEKLAELFGDFDEKGIVNAVDYLVQQKLEQVLAEKLSPIEQKHAQDAYQEHINAITAVHPDAGQIVNSDEFVNWVKAQPSYIQPSIVKVVENGSSEQVNELLTNYKASIAPQAPKEDINTKADKVIADIKPSVPNSLTDLGGANPTDPTPRKPWLI